MENILQILFDEHDIITGAAKIGKDAESLIGANDELYKSILTDLIAFFRIYADQYHHQKEEQILFPQMVKRNELLQDGIIMEMLDNHSQFREMLNEMESQIHKKKYKEASKKMHEYRDALLDHIAVENDELFQMTDSLFTDAELQNISYRFMDLDNELGNDRKLHFNDILKRTAKKMALKK